MSTIIRGSDNFDTSSELGKVLQVQTLYTTTNYANAGQTPNDLGLNVSITPKSQNSKMVVVAESVISNSDNTNYGNWMFIYKNGAEAAFRTWYDAANNVYIANTSCLTFIDEHNTTSTITYSLRIASDSSGSTSYLGQPYSPNWTRGNCTTQPTSIVVYEIGA